MDTITPATTTDILLSYSYIILVLVVAMVLLSLVLVHISRSKQVSVRQHTLCFLVSLRALEDFDEDTVVKLRDTYMYNHKYDRMEYARQNWNTDPEVFIESCITSMCLLSYYIDNSSRFFSSNQLWQSLIFTMQIFTRELKSTPDPMNSTPPITEYDDVYHVFHAFVVSMHICHLAFCHVPCNAKHLTRMVNEYLEFYSKRYNSTAYDVATTKKLPSFTMNKKTSIGKLANYLLLCRNYSKSIKL